MWIHDIHSWKMAFKSFFSFHFTKPSLTPQDKDVSLLLILLTHIKELKIRLLVTSPLSKEAIFLYDSLTYHV